MKIKQLERISMAIKPKTISNYNEIDKIIEQAIEFQERARQHYGITLETRDCIGYLLTYMNTNAIERMVDQLETIVTIATANE